ncbi:MAG: hypothetical protein PUK70_02930 [Bacteroidales bacterium]|nr:hypothetical protein [Bacteroidales bacterium]MDY6002021.1 hypothetical protein [Candidatus Cryptobacteroides sp.]
MIDWWNSLDLFMKIMWAITIAASLIFVIQTILTFIGAGGSNFDTDASELDFGGMDASGADASGAFDADPSMNLLTFRNFINFCLGFGWASVLLHDKISSTSILLIIALMIGVALVAAVMMLFKWLSGMQQAGNINVYRSAVGCNGIAYLPIPAERKGLGKVQISINNAIREFDAVTDGDAIPTGASIKVAEVINGQTLLVETTAPEII